MNKVDLEDYYNRIIKHTDVILKDQTSLMITCDESGEVIGGYLNRDFYHYYDA